MIDDLKAHLDILLAHTDAELAARYPGERGSPQPVHTVYVPADRYDAGTVAAYGMQALALLDECADVLGADDELRRRARDRLSSQPIDDLRIDFEDGYGHRCDDEEDAAVRAAARVPPSCPRSGIRFKGLEAAIRTRGLRTLDLWFAEGGRGTVTVPKVTSVAQVTAMATACEHFERTYGIDRIEFEVQIETPQAVLGPDGSATVARMVHAGQGRISGLHYGTYDYTASLGIAADHQSMEHPAADHAKAVLQLAAAGTGVFVSDGSTNVLPVGARRAAAWRLHARLIRRSLERGFYQGWDLHPAQLPSRFLATFGFFRDGMPGTRERLHAYLDRRSAGFADEPATASALAGFALRAVECGAVDVAETGCDLADLLRLARRAA